MNLKIAHILCLFKGEDEKINLAIPVFLSDNDFVRNEHSKLGDVFKLNDKISNQIKTFELIGLCRTLLSKEEAFEMNGGNDGRWEIHSKN